MTRAAPNQIKWWAILFLPIVMRALIPVGVMPMVGSDFSLQLVVCDGDGPVSAAESGATSSTATMPMSMDMPAGMVMEDADSMSGIPAHRPGHVDHGACPYGSAPVVGALPAFAILPSSLVRISLESSLATAQVVYVEASLRAQAPRGPPV